MLALTSACAIDQLVAANSRFHMLIREASHNHFIYAFAATIGPFDRSVRRTALGYAEEAERGYQEHAAILKALHRRAAGQAEPLMRSHIMRTVRFVISRAADDGQAVSTR